MERSNIRFTLALVIIFILNSLAVFTLTIPIDAGRDQIDNWDKTHSARLQGNVSSKKIKVEWNRHSGKDAIAWQSWRRSLREFAPLLFQK